MDSYQRRAEKRRCSSDFDEDQDFSDENTTTSTTSTGTNTSGKGQPLVKPVMETEKRMRREIANSNERRRMQSINAGFQSLKTLLPHHDGEKLSKAAILQQTTEYISAVDSEKRRLQAQNEQLKRMIADLTRENGQQNSPPPKRKKKDTECSDEGIGGMSAGETEEQSYEELKGEIVNLRVQVDRERRLRIALEERNRDLEARLYPTTKLTNHVQAQISYQDHMPQKATELNEEPSVRKAPEPEPQLPPQQVPQQLTPPAPVVKSEPVLTTIPQPRAHIPSMNPAATSMSRRNLETIVEAIRHLEGDSMLFDSFKKPTDSSRDIPHSEGESEKESSMYSDEEMKSESSGRDSPPLFKPHHTTTATATVHVRQEAIPVHHVSATAVAAAAAPQFVSSERYPIATQLLHRPTTLQQPFVHRPGVIVQNLS